MPTLSTPSKPKEAKPFRNNRSQAMRIPVEFELSGDHREGPKLIIEPVTKATNIVELLAEWGRDAQRGPEDQFPTLDDLPAQPEADFLSGYLLGTNIITNLIRNPDGPAARHIEQIGANEIFTSIIVASELRYAWQIHDPAADTTAKMEPPWISFSEMGEPTCQ